MAAKTITDTVRRQLWWRAGRACAFPDCEHQLFQKGTTEDEIYVGHECHIVAQRDDSRIARSVPTLTDDERARWTNLIEDRHGIDNLVLMCQLHSKLIDTVAAGYRVAAVVEIKRAHESAVATAMDRERSERNDEAPARNAAVRVLVLDDVDEWERASVKALATRDAAEFQWLSGVIGSPSDGDRCEALIDAWPDTLNTGSRELKEAAARAAERHGRWRAASVVWERAAEEADGRAAADMFARAAIAAGTIGPQGEADRDRLLVRAREADADGLRWRLAIIDDDGPPEEVLADLLLLSASDGDGPGLVGQLHLQRARAAMLADKLSHAEEHFAEAVKVDGDSLATKTMGINIVIQRGRVGVRDDRDFAANEVREASAEAMQLRSRLVEMRRFGESARLLMLAADAWAVLRDPTRARPLLERALDEELATLDGPLVLGDSALRCGLPDLALRFVADLDDEGYRRIRATARADIYADPAAPLAELERMAAAGGREAEMAAAARLGACLPPINAPFSEIAAEVLEASPHARMATGIRVLMLARVGRVADAEVILKDLPKTAWAAELRLRAVGPRAAHAVIRDAAEGLLVAGPDPAGRLLVGRAFAKVGDLGRAQTELVAVAQSASAPPALRSDAYANVIRYASDGGDWERAGLLFREWATWAASDGAVADGRISAWQVRIYHHGAYPDSA